MIKELKHHNGIFLYRPETVNNVFIYWDNDEYGMTLYTDFDNVRLLYPSYEDLMRAYKDLSTVIISQEEVSGQ